MVEFESRLKDVIAGRVEGQMQQVCPKFFRKFIKANYNIRKVEGQMYGNVIGYYTQLSQAEKNKLKQAERMFLDDITLFYKTEIKMFKGMNTRFEDKFAKYIVFSFV